MVIGVVACTAMLNGWYVVSVIVNTGREGGIGVYGCGRAEEAQQEQETGEEARQEIPCLFSIWVCD